jgi:hypothetical protein
MEVKRESRTGPVLVGRVSVESSISKHDKVRFLSKERNLDTNQPF